MNLSKTIVAAALMLAFQAQAQNVTAPSTTGTLVVVPAFGEVKAANDQAVVSFAVEEHDKDKNAAAARVNRKMKEGTDIVRRADPRAELKTMGYYTYPVYPEVPPMPQPATRVPARPVPIAWRVGQYLEVTTKNLADLPKTAAAAQKVLQINGVNFGLSPETEKKLDDQRIAATYRNLNARIVSIASAMGRNPAEAVLDTVDFEGSGNYAGDAQAANAPMMMRMNAKREMADQMPEPSFEPGETTLQMRLVGKVRFK
ncbi:SIMPL domain-containing protein [Telluria aromaticivorans]|uniref:SIMPL domain-containing protein n=1 Tax=Telluria aromaticivorans TaxID=2725995 RepID=A0A7Y2JWA7_9BURK|nr:SIMPL domain-containing protein [Telluria aromaticivorans]NNG22216.1 SIMPL domain-containing protein [Telluria aromaticivorans]